MLTSAPRRSLLRNGIYNVIGGVIRVGLQLLTIPLLMRAIGVEEFGLWTLASAVVGVVMLAEAGLSVSTTAFVSRDLVSDDSQSVSYTLTVTLGGMLVLATLAALGLLASASVLVRFFPTLVAYQRTAAMRSFQIGGLVVWARLLQQVLMGIEQACQRYDILNALNTVQAVLSNLGLLAVGRLGGLSVALMQWLAIASFIMLIAHGIASRFLLRNLTPRPAWNPARAIEVARYSGLTWLASLGRVLFTQFDRVIVGAILGPALLGIYGAITSIAFQINAFSALPIEPLLPALGNVMVRKDIESKATRPMIKQALQVNALIALGIGGTLLALAPMAMRVVISEIVTGGQIAAFRVAVAIYALYSINAVGYYVLLGTVALKELATIQIVSGIVALLLISVAGRALGLLGAVAGNAGYLGTLLLTFIGMSRLRIPLRDWSRWLRFPGAWFLAIGILNTLLPDKMGLRALIAALQGCVLLCWFFLVQRLDIRSLLATAWPREG